jgi:integrase
MKAEGRDGQTGPVFIGRRGNWLSQSTTYRRVWLPILKQAGLRHVKPSGLRRTMACLLLSRGVKLKVVRRRLDHEDIVTTLRHYAHVMPDMEEHVVWAIADMFGADSSTGVPQPAQPQELKLA